MKHDENCIFCKIVRGTASATKVFEDDHSLAFMDINPSHEGHTLVISKQHFANVLEIETATLAAVMASVQRLARSINAALAPDGIRIGQFNGAAAGQSVFHYHVHIVPIRAGQSRSIHGRGAGNPNEIQAAADRIRQALLNQK